jgi:hypothetical protein
MQGERVQVHKVVKQDSGELVAMGARLTTSMHVDGRLRRVGCCRMGASRPAERGGTLAARAARVLRQLHDADPVPFYLRSSWTATMRRSPRWPPDGRAAGVARCRPHADAGHPPGPAEAGAARGGRAVSPRACGRQRGTPAAAGRRRAAAPVLARQLQPAAGLRVEDFFVAERGSRLLACIAAWDQHAVRQTHIEAYTPWLSALRPFYKRRHPRAAAQAAARAGRTHSLPVPVLHRDARGRRGRCCAACCATRYRELRSGPWHYAITALHERDPMAVVLQDYRAIRRRAASTSCTTRTAPTKRRASTAACLTWTWRAYEFAALPAPARHARQPDGAGRIGAACCARRWPTGA